MESEFLWLWIQRTDSRHKIPRPRLDRWLCTFCCLSPLSVFACSFNFHLNILLSAIPTAWKLVSGQGWVRWSWSGDWECEDKLVSDAVLAPRDPSGPVILWYCSSLHHPRPPLPPPQSPCDWTWTLDSKNVLDCIHSHSLTDQNSIDWLAPSPKVQCAQNASPGPHTGRRLSRYKCKWKLSFWPYTANINTGWAKYKAVCKDTKFYWLLISSLHEYNIDKVIRRVYKEY